MMTDIAEQRSSRASIATQAAVTSPTKKEVFILVAAPASWRAAALLYARLRARRRVRFVLVADSGAELDSLRTCETFRDASRDGQVDFVLLPRDAAECKKALLHGSHRQIPQGAGDVITVALMPGGRSSAERRSWWSCLMSMTFTFSGAANHAGIVCLSSHEGDYEDLLSSWRSLQPLGSVAASALPLCPTRAGQRCHVALMTSPTTHKDACVDWPTTTAAYAAFAGAGAARWLGFTAEDCAVIRDLVSGFRAKRRRSPRARNVSALASGTIEPHARRDMSPLAGKQHSPVASGLRRTASLTADAAVEIGLSVLRLCGSDASALSSVIGMLSGGPASRFGGYVESGTSARLDGPECASEGSFGGVRTAIAEISDDARVDLGNAVAVAAGVGNGVYLHALRRTGGVLREVCKSAESRNAQARAIVFEPDVRNTDVLLSAAALLLACGRVRDSSRAVDSFKRLRGDAASPEACFLSAMIAARQGDAGSAAEAMRRALRFESAHTEIGARLRKSLAVLQSKVPEPAPAVRASREAASSAADTKTDAADARGGAGERPDGSEEVTAAQHGSSSTSAAMLAQYYGPLATLDRKATLSRSLMWDVQRRFYDDAGVDAWGDEGPVPFNVTTNGFIAEQYARVVLAMLGRHSSTATTGTAGGAGGASREDCVHIVELGAGHGRFGFQLLVQLRALWRGTPAGASAPSSAWPNVLLVMTDFTRSNIEIWRAHPRLRPLVEAGVLDFALFDADAPAALTLISSRAVLHPSSLKSLVVVANYVFDSVTADVFRVEKGVLHQGLVTTCVRPPDTSPDEPAARRSPEDVRSNEYYAHRGETISLNERLDLLRAEEPDTPLLNRISYRYDWEPVPDHGSSYYDIKRHGTDAAAWNACLVDTTRRIGSARVDRSFFFPVGALRSIQHLRSLWKGREAGGAFVVIASDKGHTHLSEVVCDDDTPPYIARHGSISTSVHFDAFSYLFESAWGGRALLPWPPRRHASISTVVFALGCRTVLDMVTVLFSESQEFSADDFYTLQDHWKVLCRTPATPAAINADLSLTGDDEDADVAPFISLDQSVSMVRLARCDPDVFIQNCRSIQQSAAAADPQQRKALVDLVAGVVEQAYLVTCHAADDAMVECARLLYRLRMFKDALRLAERAASDRRLTPGPSLSDDIAASRPDRMASGMAAGQFVLAKCLLANHRPLDAFVALERAASASPRYRSARDELQRQLSTTLASESLRGHDAHDQRDAETPS